jgi:hypothetical protein
MLYTPLIARRLLTLVSVLLPLAACGSPTSPAPAATQAPPASPIPSATPAPSASPTPAATSFQDPFAYCAAVGMIDAPDARYTGERIPAVIVQAMIQKDMVSADAPPEIQQGADWRCMGGHVWACSVGANIPCQDKADTSKEPNEGMISFCAEDPSADFIPAVAAGRTTIYDWGCKDGKPTILSTVLTVDPQGYPAEYWYELAAP